LYVSYRWLYNTVSYHKKYVQTIWHRFNLPVTKKRSYLVTKVIFVKNSLEVDGRGLSPYSQAPTHDPTQRLRGNPITLNLFLYCIINI
jgi:hypothetical protein